MKNANIHQFLIDGYTRHAYTHNYMIGFNHADMVYMTICTADALPFITKLDKASRGAGYSLRFKPDKAQKALLLSMGATPICSVKMFKELCEESIYNKGEVFEKVVTEMYGQTWVKDSIPYTEKGDITVNDIHYQIKYESATFTNEKALLALDSQC